MIWRAGLIVLVLALAAGGGAAAKGLSGLVGATVSGAGLSKPVEVSISLPEDDYGWEALLYTPHPSADELPYEVVLLFDLTGKEGCPQSVEPCGKVGRQDGVGVGRFDGNDILYFPEGLRVGNGIWSPGWFRASPALAQQLRAALTSSLGAPSTGDAGLADPSADSTSSMVSALAASCLLVVAVARAFRRRTA